MLFTVHERKKKHKLPWKTSVRYKGKPENPFVVWTEFCVVWISDLTEIQLNAV